MVSAPDKSSVLEIREVACSIAGKESADAPTNHHGEGVSIEVQAGKGAPDAGQCGRSAYRRETH